MHPLAECLGINSRFRIQTSQLLIVAIAERDSHSFCHKDAERRVIHEPPILRLGRGQVCIQLLEGGFRLLDFIEVFADL